MNIQREYPSEEPVKQSPGKSNARMGVVPRNQGSSHGLYLLEKLLRRILFTQLDRTLGSGNPGLD